MKTIRVSRTLLLAAATMLSCTERNAPTASGDQQAVAFDWVAAAGMSAIVRDAVGDEKKQARVIAPGCRYSPRYWSAWG